MRSNTFAVGSGVNVLAVIMGGGQGTRLYPLTKDRSKPAVPLAGKYRLVDVPISNCINSDIRRIYVLTQFNSVSLHRHIQQTYRFDPFTTGFVDILAAQQTPGGGTWFQGTADAVRQCLRHIMSHEAAYYLILSGDQLYRMDYRLLVKQHMETEAEITIATLPVPRKSAPALGIMQVNAEKRIVRFVEKPEDPKALDELQIKEPLLSHLKLSSGEDHYLASMGIYVFNQQVLAKSLENDKPDFGKHIIPESISQRRVFAYIFNDYWEDIGTVRSFFEVHMDLTKPNPPFNFFDNRMPIHTNRRNLPASKIADSRIERVLLSPGCMINASEIVQSVIGVRAQVGAQSKLRQVVVMGADYYEDERQLRANDSIGIPHVGIGRNCSIEMTIIDKNARIGDGVKISPAGKPANLDHPLYCVRDGIAIIPKNSIIPAGTTI